MIFQIVVIGWVAVVALPRRGPGCVGWCACACAWVCGRVDAYGYASRHPGPITITATPHIMSRVAGTRPHGVRWWPPWWGGGEGFSPRTHLLLLSSSSPGIGEFDKFEYFIVKLNGLIKLKFVLKLKMMMLWFKLWWVTECRLLQFIGW